MISKAIWNKAQNLDVVKVFESGQSIEWVVGYIVRYNKRFKKFFCMCEGHTNYDIQSCSYKLATVLKGENVPEDIKEEVESEEVR